MTPRRGPRRRRFGGIDGGSSFDHLFSRSSERVIRLMRDEGAGRRIAKNTNTNATAAAKPPAMARFLRLKNVLEGIATAPCTGGAGIDERVSGVDDGGFEPESACITVTVPLVELSPFAGIALGSSRF